MSGNFKYDDYEEDFEMNNPSELPAQNKVQQPETIKMLGRERQQRKETETQVTHNNDNSTKGKLIQQHLKLKSQLKELAVKMDEISQRQRERKKKKLQGNLQQQDQRMVQMKKKLKQQQLKMQKIRSQTTRLRKNMDSKYDMNKIVDKQNELKHLKKQLAVLQEEKQALQKIRKTQDKAIKSSDDQQTKNKKARMEEQLKQITAQSKKQTQTINQKEKQVRKLHESYIMKSQKAKQIQARINEKKKPGQQQDISPQAVAKLQQELKQIEAEKAQIEKQGNQKIKNLQAERKQFKNELQRKKLILEQKQKQLRLNQMKHKEIIRFINSNQQQQIINESRVQKQNKGDAKRVVAKKGREVPKMQIEGEEQVELQKPKQEPQEQAPKVPQIVKPQKHEYGFSANLDDEGIIDDT